ncbi:hypothetical protein E2I00_001806, partial [Balaenoptera physalus]
CLSQDFFSFHEEKSEGERIVTGCLTNYFQASFSESRAPAMQTWSDLSGGTKRKAEENGRVFQNIIFLNLISDWEICLNARWSSPQWNILDGKKSSVVEMVRFTGYNSLLSTLVED